MCLTDVHRCSWASRAVRVADSVAVRVAVRVAVSVTVSVADRVRHVSVLL